MKRLIILLAALFLLSLTYGQTTIDLTFTAIDGGDYTQLDSIKVMSRTQGGDTVLYYPDTVLSFVVTGINELQILESGFKLYQNYPNPVIDQTTVTLQLPESGTVNLNVTDILGRPVISINQELDHGLHTFKLTPGNNDFFFLTATFNNYSRSIKILCSPVRLNNNVSLNYTGSSKVTSSLKSSASLQNFFFNYGDKLLYIGYYDTLQSGMLDSPEDSDTYIFQFTYDIPCPGTPNVDYEGQTYNTVQIMSQCWLKENLNVGIMIQGPADMTDNDTIEKYCYNNESDSCDKYGGLYQWDEMMQYTSEVGTQGICPPGWHSPTDEEWKLLEGAVDGQYGVGDPEWNYQQVRGFDAGKNLKSTNGWDAEGNGTNLYGFSGLPGGYYDFHDTISYTIKTHSTWWSSTERDYWEHWDRTFYSWSNGISRPWSNAVGHMFHSRFDGLSVRCVKDSNPSDNFTELSFTAVDNTSSIQLDSIKVMNRTHEGEKVLVYPDTTITLEFDLPNYHTGDQLLLVGYYDTLQSGMIDIPEESKTYEFQFAYNIPCPDMPTVVYEGQTYNTVQIMSQCWLKENLNVGTRINADTESSDNDIIEKYCYNNLESNCNLYGGFYQWDEMMNYNHLGGENGVRGICPPGWHISSDEEWKMLEGAADSQYGIGDSIWNEIDYRGFDAGTNLKTDNNWNGTDLFGFTGLPSGYRAYDGNFYGLNDFGGWWVSTESNDDNAWFRGIVYNYQEVRRHPHHSKVDGLSVRCIKD